MVLIRVIGFIIVWASALLFAQTNSGQKTVSLDCDNRQLKAVLNEVSIQTETDFIYSDALVSNINVSCRFNNLPIKPALNSILKETRISFKIFNERTIVLYKKKEAEPKSEEPVIVNIEVPRVDSVDIETSPVLIKTASPPYPLEAKVKNIEGEVVVGMYITEKGDVDSVQIVKSSGSQILDSATQSYAKNLKFIPAKRNGKPRSISVLLTFCYNLE